MCYRERRISLILVRGLDRLKQKIVLRANSPFEARIKIAVKEVLGSEKYRNDNNILLIIQYINVTTSRLTGVARAWSTPYSCLK